MWIRDVRVEMFIAIASKRERGARIVREPADHPYGERHTTSRTWPVTSGRSPSRSRTLIARLGGEPGQL